jgi:hypothetical protein
MVTQMELKTYKSLCDLTYISTIILLTLASSFTVHTSILETFLKFNAIYHFMMFLEFLLLDYFQNCVPAFQDSV